LRSIIETNNDNKGVINKNLSVKILVMCIETNAARAQFATTKAQGPNNKYNGLSKKGKSVGAS
jgi:hypothetical protein